MNSAQAIKLAFFVYNKKCFLKNRKQILFETEILFAFKFVFFECECE